MNTTGLTFGPIPSRRLGQSLGINNTLLPKACSYNCAYCQAGRSHYLEIERRAFFSPQEIYKAVSKAIQNAEKEGVEINYLSFVPDGEPTLDIQLGESIRLLKTLGKRIAVFTNASLIWRPEVRADLALADWVSLKFDAVLETAWRRTDRPQKYLSLPLIMDGALAFARQFRGALVTETMLCADLNDMPENLTATAEYIATLSPSVAYLGVPTRPPLEKWALPPDEAILTQAFAIFAARIPKVELMVGYPPPAYQPGNDAERDIPAILAVHPIREAEMQDYLTKGGYSGDVLERLLHKGIIKKTAYAGEEFWLRVM
ncbi:MAG TPA: radical SAM protein [Saprospiraceae bacterium]|nr:radical SAM protein [Saprospiraceae bacterium]